MKSTRAFLLSAFLLTLSIHAGAQSKTGTEFFVDSWSVLLKGIPQGDSRLVFNLEQKDGQVTGAITDTAGNPISKVDKADISDSTMVLYFNAQGYDCTLTLNKKDDDHVIGNLMNMFDAEGERKKLSADIKK
jgi:hypothetical protein